MNTGVSSGFHRDEQQRRFSSSTSSERVRLLMIVTLLGTLVQLVGADPKLSTHRATSSNLFNEYITRGLFSCTRDYVKSLTDLHILMRELYENYESCKKQVQNADKSYPQTPFAYLNDLMHRYQMADNPKDVAAIEKEIVSGPDANGSSS